MTVFGDRLKEKREAAGLSQSALARASGCTPQTIQAIEAGNVQRSKFLNSIATILKCDPAWLSGESHLVKNNGAYLTSARVRGVVAAGLWQEDNRQIGDETPVPASPDSKYARLPQIAFRVIGNSMNRLVSDGEYVICVDYAVNPLPLREGDVVVAERHRDGQIERTIKRVRGTRNGFELWPESDDPAHQKPVQMRANDPDFEVRIAGLVIGSYRPI